MVSETIGHLHLYAEAKKMRSLTLHAASSLSDCSCSLLYFAHKLLELLRLLFSSGPGVCLSAHLSLCLSASPLVWVCVFVLQCLLLLQSPFNVVPSHME